MGFWIKRLWILVLTLFGIGCEILMQIAPHDAITNLCIYSAWVWPNCAQFLPRYEGLAGAIPVILIVSGIIWFLWPLWKYLVKPDPPYLSLKEAAGRLYGKMRGTIIAQIAEEKPGGRHDSEEHILDSMGTVLAFNARLQVRKSPSPVWEEFDKEMLPQMSVCGGATGLRYHGQKVLYFTEIRIRTRDFRRAVSNIKRSLHQPMIPAPQEIDNSADSPLEIIFDPSNPGRKFWSLEPVWDDDHKKPLGSQWEYRAVIKNASSKTLYNARVIVEATGPMPTRPEYSLFDINKKPLVDLAPHEEALVIVRHWFSARIVAGVAYGTDVYGPIKVTAHADNVPPATKTFHFDPEKTPMIWE